MNVNKIINYADYIPRKVLNTLTYTFAKKRMDKFCQCIIESDKQAEITGAIADIFLRKKDVLCNFEEKHFQDLINSNSPTIFVMNHSKQISDVKLMCIFNSLLNMHYFIKGRPIPQSKIVVNENIIKSQPAIIQKVYEKTGVTGINIFSATASNIRKFFGLINGYINENNNIFIFPEGKNCCKKNAKLKEKFQDGVSKIAKQIAESGKTAKIIPLGFAYGKNKSLLGSIYAGKPLYFKKSGQKLITNGEKIEEVKSVSDISNRIINAMEKSIESAKKRYINPDETRL